MTAPYLSPFLPDVKRNRDSLAAAWQRKLELGYTTRTKPVEEPEGCTRTRCAGVHEGYPGSEHRWALHCLLDGVDIEVFYSHMRERKGANPAAPPQGLRVLRPAQGQGPRRPVPRTRPHRPHLGHRRPCRAPGLTHPAGARRRPPRPGTLPTLHHEITR